MEPFCQLIGVNVVNFKIKPAEKLSFKMVQNHDLIPTLPSGVLILSAKI
jgi:hypothetical protein